MRRHHYGAGPDERGSALVEMSLLAPALVLLLAGMLELGRVMEVWVVTANAAREGARQAALGHTATEVRQTVQSYLQNSLSGRPDIVLPISADIVVTNAGGQPGQAVTVSVSTGVMIITPGVQALMPANPLPVHGSLSMRLQ